MVYNIFQITSIHLETEITLTSTSNVIADHKSHKNYSHRSSNPGAVCK